MEVAVTLISTKGRYALRVMTDLAQQDVDGYIPLEEIANRQGISKKYLEIILKVLITIPERNARKKRGLPSYPPPGGVHGRGDFGADRGDACECGMPLR